MANRLTMSTISAIDTLRKTGRSRRQVAELLGIHRETVGKYFDRLQNQPNAPPGSDGPLPDPDPPVPATVAPGPASACEPFRDLIGAKLQQGLTAQRIYQDLVTERGFAAKYHSVRRFVARLLQRSSGFEATLHRRSPVRARPEYSGKGTAELYLAWDVAQ